MTVSSNRIPQLSRIRIGRPRLSAISPPEPPLFPCGARNNRSSRRKMPHN